MTVKEGRYITFPTRRIRANHIYMHQKEDPMRPIYRVLFALIVAAALGGCADGIKKEASYPTRQKGSDKILYSDQKRETRLVLFQQR